MTKAARKTVWGAGIVIVVLAVLLAVALFGRGHPGHHPTTLPTTTPSPPATVPSRPIPAPQATAPAGSFNVVSDGADPSGQRDSTMAIRTAFTAAQKQAHSTVYFPPGRYILALNDGSAQDFDITANPVNVVGAGRDSTTIVEEIGAKYAGSPASKAIFQIGTGPNGQAGGGDGTTITGLTLDSASYDAGTTIVDFANDTTISHMGIRGARSDHQYNKGVFGLRVIAICNHSDLASKHRDGNIVDDMVMTGQGSAGNTDLDLSCQTNASVSDVTDTGNGMDIYICDNVVVSGYTFTPGTVEASPKSYVITGPTNNVSISNVTTYGNGGQLQPSPNGYSITNTVIANETMKNLSFDLTIGDANQTTIRNSTIGVLRIVPKVSAAGVSVGASSVASVVCSKKGAITGLVGVACP